jgi:2-polyprenyl-3-methyl-5-hydroxy-6-metoxy-1,4-benzoquinol methylase
MGYARLEQRDVVLRVKKLAMDFTLKHHWETVYQTKDTTKVGWFQNKPQVSIDWISKLKIPKNAPIIDVGGGDGCLVDLLLDQGFEQITVLDISDVALEKVRSRLGPAASKVHWKACDILEFQPEGKFELWHDRAVFHFLTDPQKQGIYRQLVERAVAPGGYLVMMTFSKSGPKTCSGLPVQQYDVQDLEEFFSKEFFSVESFNYDHLTPSGIAQNYTVCLFRRR